MGKRGEGWVLIQVVIFLVYLLVPRLEGFSFPDWLTGLGWVLCAAGGVLLLLGLLHLGPNLSPFPKPIEGGRLVTAGVYAIVRHPIYAGLVFAALGWGVISANVWRLVVALGLLGFFDLKSQQEEAWLIQKYPEYAAYRRRVRKLIPWVY